jgi:hypothetical protein
VSSHDARSTVSRRPTRLEIALVSVIFLVTAVYVRWTYIPSFFDRHVQVSEERFDFEVGEPGPWFSAWSLGDGQAYVLIALDPTGQKLAEEVPEPGYRYARAGYGWLGWLTSLGNDRLVPYALALIGATSMVGILIAAIVLRPLLGIRAWLLLMNPAIYIGFAGDTAEPLAALLLTLGLMTGSWALALILGLTYPTYLVATWGRWKMFLVGVATAVAVQIYTSLAFGPPAVTSATVRVGFPFVGYLDAPSAAGFALCAAGLATIAIGARSRAWAWVISGLFVLCFAADVLQFPTNAWRAAGFLPVLWAFAPRHDPERTRLAFKVRAVSDPAAPVATPPGT